jgi:hypothetical protein
MAAQFVTCKKTNDIDPTMDAGFLPKKKKKKKK